MTLITQVRFKQKNTFSLIALPDINTRGCGRIRDSYAKSRVCIRVSQPPECLYQSMQTQEKKFSIAFLN